LVANQEKAWAGAERVKFIANEPCNPLATGAVRYGKATTLSSITK
jgi:hypothetical protein